jgi:Delta7-sterol 5-desaturase
MKDNMSYILPLVMNVVRYFLFAGIPFLIFYILFPNVFTRNKIQARIAKRKDFIREIRHSLQTTFILAGVGILLLKTPLKEYTQVYDNLSAYPLWWIPVSVILVLLVHDTYFYWMHRTVHHPKLFKQIHSLHHKSVNPSPWASYSFQFAEGVLEAMIAPIIILLIPMHPLSLLLFTLAAFIINVYGHLGYEIAPKWFRHSLLFEIMNTSTHHNIHHAKFNGNYGLYFRIWDRIMGTEHPDYVQEYDEIQKRRFGVDTPSSFSWNGSLFLFFILAVGLTMIAAKSPDGIEGKWKDDNDGGVIMIYEEDGLYYGQLIGADKQEDNQKIQEYGKKIILMKNFEKKSSKEYCCGTIIQPREKRTITATLILIDKNTLKINGQYGVFTGSRILKRL